MPRIERNWYEQGTSLYIMCRLQRRCGFIQRSE